MPTNMYAWWQHALTALSLLGLAITLCGLLMASSFGRAMRDGLKRCSEMFLRNGKVCRVVLLAFFCGIVQYGATKGFWGRVRSGGGDNELQVVGIYTAMSNDVQVVDGGESITNKIPLVRVEWLGNGGSVDTPVSIRETQTNEWAEIEKIEPIEQFTEGATNVLQFATTTNYSSVAYWWFGTELPAIIITEEGIEIREFKVTTKAVYFSWVCGETEATSFIVQRKELRKSEWESMAEVPAIVGRVNSVTIPCFSVDKTYDWRIITEIAEVTE